MLRPETMHRVRVVGLRKSKKAVMSQLQASGVVHLKKASFELGRETPDEVIHEAVRELEMIRRVKSLLARRHGIVSSLLGEQAVRQGIGHGRPMSDAEFGRWAKRKLGKIRRPVKSLAREERELASEKAALKERIKKLEDFAGLKVGLEDLGEKKHVVTGLATVRAGRMERLRKLASVTDVRGDDKTRAVLFAVLRNKWGEASRLLSLLEVDGRGPPRKVMKDCRHRLKSIEERLDALAAEKERLAGNMPLLLAIEEGWRNIKNRASKEKLLNRTRKTFVAEGWAPSSGLEKLRPIRNAVVYIEEEKSEAPVKLSNPSFVKFFESITRWFAMPKYGGFDPTLFIAIAFPVFFAIMLTDAAYGLGLAAVGLYIRRNAGSEGARSVAGILIVSSALTVLAGLAFGSVFGDALGFPSLLDTLRDPITIMKLSLGIGLVHINLGLVLGLASGLREKNAWASLDSLSWLAFEAALAVGAAGLLGIVLPGWAGSAALVLVLLTLAVQARKGIVGVIGVPGFVGTWISYVRIMAVAVATSWLAFVINMGAAAMASVSLVPAALFFGAAHLFLWALNAISAFVHSMRLHYVEFFKLFYEGGGREYEPLRLEKKYHKVAEQAI